MKTSPPTPRELRRFGLLVGGIFDALALWMLYRSGWTSTGGIVFAGVGTALILLGLAVPRSLAPVHGFWMGLALVLGWINTRIILGALFYTVFAVTRLALALARKDPMHRRPDRARGTYWTDLPREFDPKSYENTF